MVFILEQVAICSFDVLFIVVWDILLNRDNRFAFKYWHFNYLGLLGFFVSWQYGACYSWVAQKGDISGRPASIFFIG